MRTAEQLERKITELRAMIEQIVVGHGEDAGVILLSDESPTHYNTELKACVYDHENFSPLGDALVKLWEAME